MSFKSLFVILWIGHVHAEQLVVVSLCPPGVEVIVIPSLGVPSGPDCDNIVWYGFPGDFEWLHGSLRYLSVAAVKFEGCAEALLPTAALNLLGVRSTIAWG